MYKIFIEEMETICTTIEFNGQLFLYTNNAIYKYSNECWIRIFDLYNNNNNFDDISAVFNIFWGTSKISSNNTYTYLGLNTPPLNNIKVQQGGYLSGLILDKKKLNYVALEYIERKEAIVTGTLSSSTPDKRYPFESMGGIISYQGNFIVRGGGDDSALICLDASLTEIWKTPLQYDNRATRGLPCSPELYKNIVYMNMPKKAIYQPATQPKLIPMDIGAYSADTGRLIWKNTLPSNARNADLHGSEVFIANDYFLQIRDVNTGDVVWDMQPFWAEDEIPNLLYPLNKQDLLVNFQFKNKALILNRTDKTIKQTIILPEKSYYCFSTITLPRKVSDTKWVWTISYDNPIANARNSGVIMIDLDESQPSEVKAIIKPRPKHKLKGKTMENGEKEYFLNISHNDLNEVVRYGIIIVKNLAYDKGRHAFSPRPDRKHNGRVNVIIDKAALEIDKPEDEIISALNTIKVFVEKKLQISRVKAGNKVNEFDIRIELI